MFLTQAIQCPQAPHAFQRGVSFMQLDCTTTPPAGSSGRWRPGPDGLPPPGSGHTAAAGRAVRRPPRAAAQRALPGANSPSPSAPGGFASGWHASVVAGLKFLPLAILPPPPADETVFDPSSPPRAAPLRQAMLSPRSLPRTQLLEEGGPFIHKLFAPGIFEGETARGAARGSRAQRRVRESRGDRGCPASRLRSAVPPGRCGGNPLALGARPNY